MNTTGSSLLSYEYCWYSMGNDRVLRSALPAWRTDLRGRSSMTGISQGWIQHDRQISGADPAWRADLRRGSSMTCRSQAWIQLSFDWRSSHQLVAVRRATCVCWLHNRLFTYNHCGFCDCTMVAVVVYIYYRNHRSLIVAEDLRFTSW